MLLQGLDFKLIDIEVVPTAGWNQDVPMICPHTFDDAAITQFHREAKLPVAKAFSMGRDIGEMMESLGPWIK